MLEGIFEIESDEMDEISSYYRKTYVEIDSMNDEAKTDFLPLKKAEVFGNGAQKINNQLDLIGEKFTMLSDTLQKCTSAIFEEEFKLKDEVSSIQIPKNFAVNDFSSEKSFENVSLNKNDGRSVNDGNDLQDNTEEFNSRVQFNNDLQNINNEKGMVNQNLNFGVDGEEVKLENINKNSEEKEEELNFRLDGNETKMEDISNGSLETSNLDFEITGEKENLTNINNNNNLNEPNNLESLDDIEVLED